MDRVFCMCSSGYSGFVDGTGCVRLVKVCYLLDTEKNEKQMHLVWG